MRARLKLLTRNRYLVRRLQRSFIFETIRGRHFPRVADIGCGRSPYKKLISHDVFIPVDKENDFHLDHFVAADISRPLPFEDSSFDLVLLTEVLEHMPHPQETLREIFRVLKTGGEILITTPFAWEVHEAPFDFYRYTRFGVAHLLNTAGFKGVVVHETNGFFYSMMQLVVMRMRHPFFVPLVFVLNVLGYLAYKIERPSGFPLSIHALAKK